MSSILTGKIPKLLIGKRIATPKGYLSSLPVGQLIKEEYQNARFVTHIQEGAKEVNPLTSVYMMPLDQGVHQEKNLKGFGAYGIGYIPVVTETKPQDVRRSPRDWHGNNIKN